MATEKNATAATAGSASGEVFFFFSLAERAITAVPVAALPLEAIVTSSAMPRWSASGEVRSESKMNVRLSVKIPTYNS